MVYTNIQPYTAWIFTYFIASKLHVALTIVIYYYYFNGREGSAIREIRSFFLSFLLATYYSASKEELLSFDINYNTMTKRNFHVSNF